MIDLWKFEPTWEWLQNTQTWGNDSHNDAVKLFDWDNKQINWLQDIVINTN